jgi:hypothetical protein
MKRFTLSWLAIICMGILIAPNSLTSEEMIPLPHSITYPNELSIPLSQLMRKVQQLTLFLTIELEGWKPDKKNVFDKLNHRIYQQYRAKSGVIQIDFFDFRMPPAAILLLGFPSPDFGDKFMKIKFVSLNGSRETLIEGFRAIEISNIKDGRRSILINLNNHIIVGIAGSGLDNMNILNHVAHIMKLKQIANLKYPE